MKIILVNPMDETERSRGRRASRLDSLSGRTLGLLDISKPGGGIFLDYIERALIGRFGIARAVRVTKPTFTRPAPDSVMRSLRNEGCHGVIEALAD